MMKLLCRDSALSLDGVGIVGILNTTPDSFSDGGMWLDCDAAVKHGLEMAAQGAMVIDVGGESTRPGAEPVSETEELRRVLPVIAALAASSQVAISIDTRKVSVARRAIDAGASIINDTSGEGANAMMDALAADSGAGVIVMHSRGTPATMRSLTEYSDVVSHVVSWLRQRAKQLEAAGVRTDSIVLDPGVGFAKTGRQSLELLGRLKELVDLGYPVLVGTSRKSFIGEVLDLPTEQRLEGTAATVAWAVAEGASLVRVHDVEPIVRTIGMTRAICSAAKGAPLDSKDRIYVRDLRLEAHVGVTEEERARPQPVIVTLEIFTDLKSAATTDELAETVDYSEAVRRAEEVVTSAESKLLEHLAEEVAGSVASLKNVRGVTVEISKEAPPMPQRLGEVGVRISRERKRRSG